MNDADNSPSPSGLPPVPPPASMPPPPPRSGLMTAFMVIVGVILLLPGLCALGFGAFSLTEARAAATVMPFVVVGLFVGFGGVMMILAAIRGRQR